MTERALVGPDGQIVRVASNIAPDAGTKPGFQWVPVTIDGTQATEFHELSGPVVDVYSVDPIIVRRTWTARPISEVRAILKSRIDGQAEAARLAFVTGGSGQALVYEAKRTEAARWIAAGSPLDPSQENYPWAAARAKRKEQQIADVLAEWVQTAMAWAVVARAIEDVREAAKEAVGAAKSVDEAVAALADLRWPQP